MRPCELSAHLARLVQQVAVVLRQPGQIEFTQALALQLCQDLVVPFEYVLDIVLEVTVEALKVIR